MKRNFSRIMAAVVCVAVLMSFNGLQISAENFSESAMEKVYSEKVADTTVEAALTEDSAATENADLSEEKVAEEKVAEEAISEEDMSFTEKIAAKFANSLGKYIPDWLVVLIVSMMPILELRAGLFVAKFLNFDLVVAIPICVIGNIIPIPFILLFIRKIFEWLGKTKLFHKMIEKLEERAMKKSTALSNGEFWGLVLFVGIPIPGTGAWMGSLIAALLEIDIKKAIAAELVGIVIATIIVSIISYGLLGIFI